MAPDDDLEPIDYCLACGRSVTMHTIVRVPERHSTSTMTYCRSCHSQMELPDPEPEPMPEPETPAEEAPLAAMQQMLAEVMQRRAVGKELSKSLEPAEGFRWPDAITLANEINAQPHMHVDAIHMMDDCVVNWDHYNTPRFEMHVRYRREDGQMGISCSEYVRSYDEFVHWKDVAIPALHREYEEQQKADAERQKALSEQWNTALGRYGTLNMSGGASLIPYTPNWYSWNNATAASPTSWAMSAPGTASWTPPINLTTGQQLMQDTIRNAFRYTGVETRHALGFGPRPDMAKGDDGGPEQG